MVFGSSSVISSNSIIGKRIFFCLFIVCSCIMWIFCFVFVVSVFIIGGWINGISVIYEYVVIVMVFSSFGVSLFDR